MKCNSCSELISPKMKKAVENNICPFCGDKIVPDELRKSLTELDTVMMFLLEKFETETLDYLKDRYGISNRPMNTQTQHRASSDQDISDTGEDIALSEKLKDKNFRKNYLAAQKIQGSTKNEFAEIMAPEENPYRSSKDDDDYGKEEEMDPGIARQLAALAASRTQGGNHKSDKEKMEEMISKSKKSFSPPSF